MAITYPLPTAEVAYETVDPTRCYGGEWNEAVLVRRMTEAVATGAMTEAMEQMVREGVAPMPLGAERDGVVMRTLGNVVKLIIACEDMAKA